MPSQLTESDYIAMSLLNKVEYSKYTYSESSDYTAHVCSYKFQIVFDLGLPTELLNPQMNIHLSIYHIVIIMYYACVRVY